MKSKRPTPKDVAVFTNSEPPAPKPKKNDPKKPEKQAPQALVGGMGFYPKDPSQK